MVGKFDMGYDQSPLCPTVSAWPNKQLVAKNLSFHLHIIFSPLKSKTTAPTSCLSLAEDGIEGEGFGRFQGLVFLGLSHVYILFSPVNLSHENLIFRPART